TVGTDTTNRFSFAIAVPPGVGAGSLLTAISIGSVSEFAGNVAVSGGNTAPSNTINNVPNKNSEGTPITLTSTVVKPDPVTTRTAAGSGLRTAPPPPSATAPAPTSSSPRDNNGATPTGLVDKATPGPVGGPSPASLTVITPTPATSILGAPAAGTAGTAINL